MFYYEDIGFIKFYFNWAKNSYKNPLWLPLTKRKNPIIPPLFINILISRTEASDFNTQLKFIAAWKTLLWTGSQSIGSAVNIWVLHSIMSANASLRAHHSNCIQWHSA